MKKSKQWDEVIERNENLWKKLDEWTEMEKKENWFQSLYRNWFRKRYLKRHIKTFNKSGLTLKNDFLVNIFKNGKVVAGVFK